MRIQVYYLLLLAMLEGAAVMVCELLGAKLIGPYFGGSLYVWASALGVTLTALMVGYYFGGRISSKATKFTVYWILILAGLLLMIMPETAYWVMGYLVDSDEAISVQKGSLISLSFFMAPQLILFGMTSPVIIHLLSTDKNKSGKTAGSVYALSTLGGILATFLLGFYLLPAYGIELPALIFGLLLIIPSIGGLFFGKKLLFGTVASGIAVCCAFVVLPPSEYDSRSFKVRYKSDGILGQIKVIDQELATYTKGVKPGRVLFVNNIAQTMMNRENPNYSLYDWAYYFPAAASVFPEKSEVLLLGLGGGTLVKQFERLNFNIDVVEIDERVRDVALNYFHVNKKTNITIDDGRHFVNTTKKKYDLITLDVFISEAPPAQLISVESFRKMKEHLKPGGMVMMNFYGYLSGDIGRPGRSVYKTFQEAGFDTKLFVSPGSEGGRNLIFLACTDEKDFTKCMYTEPGLPVLGDITQYFVDPASLDMTNALVLTDKVPILEKLYIECALDWRNSATEMSTRSFIDEGIH